MASERPSGTTGLVLVMLLLIVAGTPLVAYAWETLNQLMAGRIEPRRLVITLPAVALLAGLLRIVQRVVTALGPDHGPVMRGES